MPEGEDDSRRGLEEDFTSPWPAWPNSSGELIEMKSHKGADSIIDNQAGPSKKSAGENVGGEGVRQIMHFVRVFFKNNQLDPRGNPQNAPPN